MYQLHRTAFLLFKCGKNRVFVRLIYKIRIIQILKPAPAGITRWYIDIHTLLACRSRYYKVIYYFLFPFLSVIQPASAGIIGLIYYKTMIVINTIQACRSRYYRVIYYSISTNWFNFGACRSRYYKVIYYTYSYNNINCYACRSRYYRMIYYWIA